MEHEIIVKKVIDAIKEEEHDELLNKQFDNSEKSIKDSDCGFFVSFTKIPKEYRKDLTRKYDYVYGRYEDDTPKVGFIVYMENGLIKMLEAYTFGNISWPENEDLIKLFIQK